MFRLLADADLDDRLPHGLIRRQPDIDVVLARDVGIDDWTDDRVLEWASVEDRLVVSHDRNTMTRFIKERIAAGHPTTGLIVIDRYVEIGRAVEEVLTAIICSDPAEWMDRTIYIPLR